MLLPTVKLPLCTEVSQVGLVLGGGVGCGLSGEEEPESLGMGVHSALPAQGGNAAGVSGPPQQQLDPRLHSSQLQGY